MPFFERLCAGMTVKRDETLEAELAERQNEAIRRNASDINEALPATIGALFPTTSARYRCSNPHCLDCFSHCSFHCFHCFLRRRLFRCSFKALHCNWRQFSIVNPLYFCAGTRAC